ncbi:MAG TPA: hypothetical protein VFK31_09285, partial [Rhodanobacteraceae bacterium]|nr:hypothetical protein [Rhodanobacteraceae bacterium]
KPKWNGDGLTCLVYYGSPAPVTINWLNNVVWNVRSNECPATSICKDPQLVNESLAGFNQNPLVSSPAIGNASTNGLVTTHDYYGNTRASKGATIGAVEYRGQAFLGSGSGDSPLPPGGGTQPASDLPVPTPQATAVPVPAELGLDSGSGALRGRVRGALAGERHYAAGSGSLQQGVQQWRQQGAATGTTDTSHAPIANTATAVPAVAAEPAVAAAAKPAPASRSYLLAVFDWFADVYHKSRQAFQY